MSPCHSSSDSVATISVDQGTVAVGDQSPTGQGLKLFSFIYVLSQNSQRFHFSSK